MERDNVHNWNKKVKQCMKKHLLTILIVSAVALGIIIGVSIRLSRNDPISDEASHYISFVGSILIRMLKLIATPLIVACVICAIGSINIGVIKILGWQVVALMCASNMLAGIIGLTLVVAIHPGEVGQEIATNLTLKEPSTMVDVFLDMIRNIVPNNNVDLFIYQYKTKLIQPEEYTEDYYAWGVQSSCIDIVNILGIITIAFLFGLCLTILKPKGERGLIFIKSLYFILMMITEWILWIAAPFIFLLVISELLSIHDLQLYASTWGMFVMTVIIANCVLLFILFPLFLLILAQTNPLKFYMNMAGVYATAFGTASSLGTLPIAIDRLKSSGVDERSRLKTLTRGN